MKKALLRRTNGVLERLFGARLVEVKPEDASAERTYWARVLQDFYREKYDLAMHPIQIDEAIVPPHHIVRRVQNIKHASPDSFFAESYKDAFYYFTTLDRHGVKLNSVQSILDFGVGFGRLLINYFPFSANLFGCDITPEAAQWSQARYGERAEIRLTSPDPPLPYDDGCFQLIYANAVFIHIPYSKQDEWIRELKRISKPGGYVLATYYEPSVNLANWSARDVHGRFAREGWFEVSGNKHLNYKATNTFIDRALILSLWAGHFTPLEFVPRFKKHTLLIVRNDAP